MVKKEKKPAAQKKEKLPLVDLSLAGIKKFIDFAKGFQVSSISLKDKDKKITVTQNVSVQPSLSAPSAITETENTIVPHSDEVIKSKFVGLYRPAKGIAAGTAVKTGQTLAQIYAMNLDHQVKAEKDCVIKKVLLAENDPVDYGKPLFIIE